jgi:hypothetical protein
MGSTAEARGDGIEGPRFSKSLGPWEIEMKIGLTCSPFFRKFLFSHRDQSLDPRLSIDPRL